MKIVLAVCFFAIVAIGAIVSKKYLSRLVDDLHNAEKKKLSQKIIAFVLFCTIAAVLIQFSIGSCILAVYIVNDFDYFEYSIPLYILSIGFMYVGSELLWKLFLLYHEVYIK